MSSTTSRARIRALAAIAVLGAASAALAGCSTAAGGGSDSKTLSVEFNGGTAMPLIIKNFEKANPGVKIVPKNVNDPDGQIVATQLTGGNAADVIGIQPGTGGVISAYIAGNKGYLADLSGESWAKTVPATAKKVLVNSKDQLMGVPMTFSSIGGVYNATALKSVGLSVPTTFPEVLQFCADAKAKSKVAYGLGLSDQWTTQLIPYALVATEVYASDPDFTAKQNEGKVTFSNSGWKTAMDQFTQMGTAGCFNKSPAGTPYASVQTAVAKGTTLATVTVAAETASIKKLAASSTTMQYAALPATSNAADTYLAANIGPTYAVNAKAKNPTLAKKFVAYLAQPATQVAYANEYGDTAAMPGDLKQDTQVSDLVTGYVSENKISNWPDNQWPPASALKNNMYSGIQGMFSGQATAATTLKAMDTAFQASVKK